MKLREVSGAVVMTLFNCGPDVENLDCFLTIMSSKLVEVAITFISGAWVVHSHSFADRGGDVERVKPVFLSGGKLSARVTCRLASFHWPVESMSGSTGNPFPVLVRIEYVVDAGRVHARTVHYCAASKDQGAGGWAKNRRRRLSFQVSQVSSQGFG
jgi:hypothetical protein